MNHTICLQSESSSDYLLSLLDKKILISDVCKDYFKKQVLLIVWVLIYLELNDYNVSFILIIKPHAINKFGST